MVSHRGHIQHESLLEDVSPGTSQETLLQRYGSPSSRSGFGEETWYYIQSRKEGQAFLKPKITEQQVIAVVFDSGGAVKEVKEYGLDDSREVVVVDDITPTEGHSIGFFEQVLGNVGRFNTPDREVSPRGVPGR